MEYRSAVFDSVKEILRMSEEKDPRLMMWFSGILGAPSSLTGADSIQAFYEFNQFCARTLQEGPLRVGDLKKINEMILMQLAWRSGLTMYDAGTGIEWKWDGTPLSHVIVTELNLYAAKLLEDSRLAEECAIIQWKALESFAAIDKVKSEAGEWKNLAEKRIALLEQRYKGSNGLSEVNSSIDQLRKRRE